MSKDIFQSDLYKTCFSSFSLRMYDSDMEWEESREGMGIEQVGERMAE